MSKSRKGIPEPSVVRRRLSQLVPWEGNPREHDAEQLRHLKASFERFGLVSLPVIQAGTNRLIAGHGRLEALRSLHGDIEIPVLEVPFTDEEALAHNIADNRLAELARWNLPALKAALDEIEFDLEPLGFTEQSLADLLSALDDGAPEGGILDGADPDEVPEPPAEPFARRGDLYLLGKHRLLCGDATHLEDVRLLMDGKEADLVLTDPPYGVAYKSESKKLKAEGKASIQNDALQGEEFQAFLDKVCEHYALVSARHAAFYVFYPSRYHIAFETALLRAGISVRSQIIWVKNAASFGFSQYKWKHEPLLFGAKAGEVPLIFVPQHESAFYAHHTGEAPVWNGDRAQTTVWQVARETNTPHPTTKPVDLLRKPIGNSSKPGSLVLDFFGGSGSCLITCEIMGRACYTLELDEKFIDVIRLRWEKATGRQATLLRGGKETRIPR